MRLAFRAVEAGLTLLAGTLEVAAKYGSFIPIWGTCQDRALDMILGSAESFEYVSTTTPADPLKLD